MWMSYFKFKKAAKRKSVKFHKNCQLNLQSLKKIKKNIKIQNTIMKLYKKITKILNTNLKKTMKMKYVQWRKKS